MVPYASLQWLHPDFDGEIIRDDMDSPLWPLKVLSLLALLVQKLDMGLAALAATARLGADD